MRDTGLDRLHEQLRVARISQAIAKERQFVDFVLGEGRVIAHLEQKIAALESRDMPRAQAPELLAGLEHPGA